MPRPLWSFALPVRSRVAAAGQVALFLDYDGTLAPIARHPSLARLPVGVKRLLRRLLALPGVWVALVSGRALKDLQRMVGLKGICCVGNHGLELEGPKMRHVNPAARRCRPVLRKIAKALAPRLRRIRGAWVEDKGLTLSVHYRRAASSQKILVRNRLNEVVRPYRERGQVRVTHGKEVIEVRPPVRWDKGTMVRRLLDRRDRVTGAEVLPIYVGDDLTDEDAFKALGRRGITVAVGPADPLTRAAYVVKSTSDVKKFLELIVKARSGAGERRGGASRR